MSSGFGIYTLGDLYQSNFSVGGGETKCCGLRNEWEMKSGSREYGLLT